MPASDHVHPQQLRLFIPAKELHTTEMVSETHELRTVFSGDGAQVPWVPSSQLDHDTGEGSWRERDETADELWDRKLTESKRNVPFDKSRHEQISEHGILRPVVLTEGGTKIRDGYHRVAIANDLNPDTEVPVEYKERSEAHDFKG